MLHDVCNSLVVIALFIFGGETLRDLSLALFIGIVFGIYSTIFIATPVLYMLYKERKANSLLHSGILTDLYVYMLLWPSTLCHSHFFKETFLL